MQPCDEILQPSATAVLRWIIFWKHLITYQACERYESETARFQTHRALGLLMR